MQHSKSPHSMEIRHKERNLTEKVNKKKLRDALSQLKNTVQSHSRYPVTLSTTHNKSAKKKIIQWWETVNSCLCIIFVRFAIIFPSILNETISREGKKATTPLVLEVIHVIFSMKASLDFSLAGCIRKTQSFVTSCRLYTYLHTTRCFPCHRPWGAGTLAVPDGSATGKGPPESTEVARAAAPTPVPPVTPISCWITTFARAPRCQQREPASQRKSKPIKGINGNVGVLNNANLAQGSVKEFVRSHVAASVTGPVHLSTACTHSPARLWKSWMKTAWMRWQDIDKELFKAEVHSWAPSFGVQGRAWQPRHHASQLGGELTGMPVSGTPNRSLGPHAITRGSCIAPKPTLV